MKKQNIVINGVAYEMSRWITIKSAYVTHRHSLADYADFNEKYGYLNYFTYKNVKYALSQIMRLSHPIFFDDKKTGKTSYISGCSDSYYNPFYVELSDDCEQVRIFEKLKECYQ